MPDVCSQQANCCFTEFQLSPNNGFANNSIRLGSTLNTLFNSLIATKTPLQFIYSSNQPLSTPYTLKLLKFDVNLIINQSSQRLIFIELNNLERDKGNNSVKYSYNGKSLKRFDLKEIYNEVFGPTYNGEVIDGCYILSYPGISFKFKIPGDIERGGGENDDDITTVFNALFLRNPKLQSIVIHSFNHYSQIKKNSNVINLSTNTNSIELEKLIIKGKKITFKFFKHLHLKNNDNSCELVLNESNLQDVLMMIGPPDEIFNKDDSKQKIHSPDFINHDVFENNDDKMTFIFHNYYSYGLDLLYENNTLIKIIIHNNSPLNKLSFGKYEKCQFEMILTKVIKSSTTRSGRTAHGGTGNNNQFDDKTTSPLVTKEIIIHNDLYFPLIYEMLELNELKIKPILINRSNYSNSKLELINHEFDEFQDTAADDDDGNDSKGMVANKNEVIESNVDFHLKKSYNDGKLESQSLVYVDHTRDEIWEVIDNCLDSLVLY